MITVAKVSYIHEADLICMRLEEAGIDTFVADQNMASIHPLYSGGVERVIEKKKGSPIIGSGQTQNTLP